MVDYSFVTRLEGGLERAALAVLRQQAIRGSHMEAILQEALLDREYDLASVPQLMRGIDRDFVLNSFAGKEFAGVNLAVRSEFLILRQIGAGQLTQRSRSALFADMHTRVRALQCRAVMYRLCDYNPDELTFLATNRLTSRGAQRLIDDTELLAYDLQMVETLLSAGVIVDVLIPFVQFSEQLSELCARIARWFDTRPHRPRRIGVMLEVPANLFEIERFSAAQYFVFGPGDLLSFSYGGIQRNDPMFERARVEILDRPIRNALAHIDRMRGRTVYLAKTLVNLAAAWDGAQFPNTEIARLIVPSQLVPLAKV